MPDYGPARERAFLLIRRFQESGWDAQAVVDLYAEAHAVGEPGLVRLLEDVQEAEFGAAFDWTFRAAQSAE
jgi:hypothetical protein